MAQLAALIEQAVTGLGYDLVDFETSPRARLLRVFIDSADHAKGVTVDDCTTVSNHLTRLLVVENVDYDRLEVSSPGLDRPLTKLADFERFAGQEAQVKLRLPMGDRGNQRNFTGVIGVRDGQVTLRVGDTEHVIAADAIDRARLVPKY
ncbi:MAG: ribosome maturation factor RimP [Rhodocyclaceae bacterium]|nr:ribosome maturation factor RimP [Rhodocyclaceae bacterium]